MRFNTKKFLFFALLAFNANVFAGHIYCPQAIMCTSTTCYDVPNSFYISASYGSFIPGTIYHFYEADFMQLMDESYCRYTDNIKSKKAGFTLKSRAPIKADTGANMNNWFNINDRGVWPGWGGVFLCYNKANHCPFIDY